MEMLGHVQSVSKEFERFIKGVSREEQGARVSEKFAGFGEGERREGKKTKSLGEFTGFKRVLAARPPRLRRPKRSHL